LEFEKTLQITITNCINFKIQIMKPINHIQQSVSSFILKQIKLKYHTVNTYNYEKAMLAEIKH